MDDFILVSLVEIVEQVASAIFEIRRIGITQKMKEKRELITNAELYIQIQMMCLMQLPFEHKII